MKRSVQVVVASLGLSLLVLGGIGSCKQAEGERCQVQSDCEEGLLCNAGEGVCRARPSEAIDAELPPDAPPADAPVDAPDSM